ncbi:hypothetical protein BD626DRAFT_481052 [Schizophyllum amplum]|uniref:Uncharacterized protein n=1 Tax=Schizophyllum amplum TaxID=97359 RepID=A0A550CTT8_9AGAR|nr:hypothetical protein BD626DRAFT_481052 [Auriculariopsis ampla]
MLEAPLSTSHFPCDTRFASPDGVHHDNEPEYGFVPLTRCEPREDDNASNELIGSKRAPSPIFPAAYNTVYPDLSSPSSSDTSADSDDSEFPFDRQADNDALRPYVACHQLVVDSVTPWRTPHIAIEHAQHTWEQHVTALCNCAPSQDDYHLSVPPRPLHDACPSGLHHKSEKIGSEAQQEPGPVRVFSHAAFALWTQRTSIERLIFCSVVAALQRRNFQLVAQAASQLAVALYVRYESQDVFSHLERPFQWSDQALPLLDVSQHPPNTLILESDHPLTVPHIIITPEPNDEPWAGAMNLPTFPQDGRFLVVNYHGMQVWWGPEWWQAQYEAQWQQQVQYARCEACFQFAAECCCASAGVGDQSYAEQPCYWPADAEDGCEMTYSRTTEEDSSSCDDTTPPATSEPSARPTCDIFGVDEDEDELPSIEDWYKSLEHARGQT